MRRPRGVVPVIVLTAAGVSLILGGMALYQVSVASANRANNSCPPHVPCAYLLPTPLGLSVEVLGWIFVALSIILAFRLSWFALKAGLGGKGNAEG